MAVRQEYYFIYDAADIRQDAVAFEILGFEDHFRDRPFPLVYLCGDLEEASRMLEEAVICREENLKVPGMERTSGYFFQVQRTRLLSLDPIDSERKWNVFRKVVEGYNLGEVGCCSYLGAYLEENGPRLIEGARGLRGEQPEKSLSLPGGEELVAELINSFNREALTNRS